MKRIINRIRMFLNRSYKQTKKKLSKKKNQRRLFVVGSILAVGATSLALLANNAHDNHGKLQLQSQVEAKEQLIEHKANEVETIKQEKVQVEQKAVEVERQKTETEQKLKETEQKVQDLEIQVQAKKATAQYTSYARPSVKSNNKAFMQTDGNKWSFPYGYCTYFASQQRPDLAVRGNAAQWIAWSNSRTPQIGAVAVNTWAAGGLGHVAIVKAIDGNRVQVTHMNYKGFGVVSTDWTDASYWAGYIL